MKRRMSAIFLALVLVLGLCLATTLPVTAKNPPDNKPVAWVNSGSNSNHNPGAHSSEAVSVKLLSDGTTVGKVIAHNMDTGVREFGNTFDQTETLFYRDGESKIAVFAVYMHQEPSGLEYEMRFTLVDNGEGKNSDPDTLMLEFWAGTWIPLSLEPIALTNGNNQVHLPDED